MSSNLIWDWSKLTKTQNRIRIDWTNIKFNQHQHPSIMMASALISYLNPCEIFEENLLGFEFSAEKFALKLESLDWIWIIRAEVGKLNWTWKTQYSLNFQSRLKKPISARTTQLQRNFPTLAKFSNFARFFPTSLDSFQLRYNLSSLNRNFPTSDFPT